ncbi:MAG: hypothetical protein M3069_25250 [Chloroflexota bacterium]|nr:hypothetical protein [Chloroflexota bacterium]
MTMRQSRVPAAAPHELRRDRLVDVLHAHAGRPLILLWAPAGFGKSTLAAGYARETEAAVAWLTLDGSHCNPRTLFGCIREVFEEALDNPSCMPQLARGLTQGADGTGLAHLLVADLRQLGQRVILVLDDFQSVQGQKEDLQAVDLLLRHLPEHAQVVITAREPPPLSIERMFAHNTVFALGADDLRFTSEETAELRRLLGGDDSRDADADGWVTGILLGGAPHQLGVMGGTVLAGYVDRQVLARLRKLEQRWLETLAVLETITPKAAEQLLGVGPWASRLATLAERCPFLVAHTDRTYHLHGLVRESLSHACVHAAQRRPTAPGRRHVTSRSM